MDYKEVVRKIERSARQRQPQDDPAMIQSCVAFFKDDAKIKALSVRQLARIAYLTAKMVRERRHAWDQLNADVTSLIILRTPPKSITVILQLKQEQTLVRCGRKKFRLPNNPQLLSEEIREILGPEAAFDEEICADIESFREKLEHRDEPEAIQEAV